MNFFVLLGVAMWEKSFCIVAENKTSSRWEKEIQNSDCQFSRRRVETVSEFPSLIIRVIHNEVPVLFSG
jgi:hypothetical protein